ncbi:hypothetical protein X732_29020 [Mesorhizobium sp. L2C066B000]|nr:hypothetical protein X732_29020 [Mesorhizobium sp. L2C066B000]
MAMLPTRISKIFVIMRLQGCQPIFQTKAGGVLARNQRDGVVVE